ncbi:MAG: hypothetical protein LC745_13270, partial [Planctomycetia bacterium]|nr:hypothetical protein [Planctomycetia bacterium]
DWVGQQGRWAGTFGIARPPRRSPRAWLVPLTDRPSAAILGTWSGDPLDVLGALKDASPLDVRPVNPEQRVIRCRPAGSSLVLVSELADPQWEAELQDSGGARRVEPVLRAFGRPNQGAWQAVRVSGPGDWTLRLTYRARDVDQGLFISGGALTLLTALFLRFGREPARGEGEKP